MSDLVNAQRKIRGKAICIYPQVPDSCPYKGCGLHLYGVARDPKAPADTRAYQCEKGHKLHARSQRDGQ
jgi:hypothetical protein